MKWFWMVLTIISLIGFMSTNDTAYGIFAILCSISFEGQLNQELLKEIKEKLK